MTTSSPDTVRALREIARAAGFDPYSFSGAYGQSATKAATRLTEGRTHYFDESTLRYFGSRVLRIVEIAEGLALGFVTSDKAGPEDNSGRVFRAVVVDARGTVIHRTGKGSLGTTEDYATRGKADKELNEWIASHDARGILDMMLYDAEKANKREAESLADARAKFDAIPQA